MRLFQLLDAILQAERKNGKTNQELAEKAGCSHQHINDLLNHKKNVRIETLKFGTILRLFPELQKVIEDYLEHHTLAGAKDGKISQNNSPGAAASIGGDAVASSDSTLRAHLLTAILDDDTICDKCKVKVLKLLKKR